MAWTYVYDGDACRSPGVTLCLSRYRVGGREQPYERKTPLEVPSAQLGATVLFPPTPRYVKPNPGRPQGRPPAPEQIPRDLFTHLAMSSVLRKAGHRTLLGGAAFCDAGDASLEGTSNPSMSTGMHLPRMRGYACLPEFMNRGKGAARLRALGDTEPGVPGTPTWHLGTKRVV